MNIDNGSVSKLLAGTAIPKMFAVRQKFEGNGIPTRALPGLLANSMREDGVGKRIAPGMRIAITAGSRGIANVVSITRTLADFVRECGGVPFIVPAMGSHGGATAEGQLRLLAELGITGDAIGCEIRSSMEVAAVGTVNGDDVCIDKLAAEADGVIVAGRVKPHTDFRGPYESGIMKMLVIGLGKQRGAEFCHNNGMAKMAETIPLLGRVILENVNIVGAVAIIENAYDETCQIHVLRPEDVARREPELLRTAFSLMPRILFPECDLLIVDRIGKNFSGGGMDPNITGTFYDPSLSGGLKCKRVCVLDLSPESHGNFSGLGVCDATTRRVFEKIDADSTYTNALTCKVLADAKIPCVMDNDRECIQMCLKTLPGSNTAAMRVIRIPNSLHIEKIRLSESYYNEAIAHPLIEVLENPAEMRFAATGDLR